MNEVGDIGMDRATFRRLVAAYQRRWPVRLAAIAPDGQRLMASQWWPGQDGDRQREVLRFAIEEALRWGEPTVSYAPDDRLYWATPLMHNARVLGALVAGMAESQLLPDDDSEPAMDLRTACSDLRRLVEAENLTNAALLEGRRADYRREQERAEALQTAKLSAAGSLRQLYLNDEPQLVAAIRRADRGAARAVLNRILVVLLSEAGEDFDLTRSFVMELVATVSRTAVEAGGDAQQLLGEMAQRLTQLAAMDSLEALAPWLHQALERTMDLIARHRHATSGIVMSDALAFMQQRLDQDLSRDAVAAAMCLSPSHFSRLFGAHVGTSFTQALTQMRIDRARELLARSDLSLADVARRTGFRDQSYFTKVFRRVTGTTPAAWRAAQHEAS